MGDGALAIFPTSGHATIDQVCGRALAAANDLSRNIDDLNRSQNLRLEFGLGLHFGNVAYGNIGARRRLDFTVIGPAVNMTARLEQLTKSLGRRIVASEAFRNAVGVPMSHLGVHILRGIERPQNIFAPSEA
jgi:adenylate cyclase